MPLEKQKPFDLDTVPQSAAERLDEIRLSAEVVKYAAGEDYKAKRIDRATLDMVDDDYDYRIDMAERAARREREGPLLQRAGRRVLRALGLRRPE